MKKSIDRFFYFIIIRPVMKIPVEEYQDKEKEYRWI